MQRVVVLETGHQVGNDVGDARISFIQPTICPVGIETAVGSVDSFIR